MQRDQTFFCSSKGRSARTKKSTGLGNVRIRPHPHFAPIANIEAPSFLNVYKEFTVGRLPKAPAANGGEATLGNGPGNCGWEAAAADGHIRREACAMRET